MAPAQSLYLISMVEKIGLIENIMAFCFSEWYSILTRVKNAQDYELKQMHDEEANPRNAIGSLDVALIDSVVPVNLVSK